MAVGGLAMPWLQDKLWHQLLGLTNSFGLCQARSGQMIAFAPSGFKFSQFSPKDSRLLLAALFSNPKNLSMAFLAQSDLLTCEKGRKYHISVGWRENYSVPAASFRVCPTSTTSQAGATSLGIPGDMDTEKKG